jgi:hypothetical protein
MDCVIGLLLSHTALFPTGVCLKAWSLRYNGLYAPVALFVQVHTYVHTSEGRVSPQSRRLMQSITALLMPSLRQLGNL